MQLASQQDVRPARHLPFCYVCGGDFVTRRDNRPDHVPPKSIFADGDRNFPLKVAAHLSCNSDYSADDEIVGQIISVIHGRRTSKENLRAAVRAAEIVGRHESVAVLNADLKGQIHRWVRGFHAALYGQFLSSITGFVVYPPWPLARAIADDTYVLEHVKKHQAELVGMIKQNRTAGCLDVIDCNNGKLRYECTWSINNGGPICAFALKLYDWENLGDGNLSKRGCVGYYSAIKPIRASFATDLIVPIQNQEPLDPFGN